MPKEVNTCVICGAGIPEGDQICCLCKDKYSGKEDNKVRNASGCYDFTAHDAIENVSNEQFKKLSQEEYDEMRYRTFLKTIYGICKISGFYLENRLEVKDLKSGKTWR